MASNVNITSNGIQKVLKNYTPQLALAEYIWNGFDAKATLIEIKYSKNEVGRIDYIEIIDNGYGINFNELSTKFNPFYESSKAIEISAPKHTSTMHGKNGVGRLTFFTFAHNAEWISTFNDGNELKTGSIKIANDKLNSFQNELFKTPNSKYTGTKVRFTDLKINSTELEDVIIPFLTTEFCWFLELNKSNNFKIIINGEILNYDSNIIDRVENKEIKYDKTNTIFNINYIQWKDALHKEFSKYYFLNGNNVEIFKDFTTLNKKGDEFYHSIYISSDFFNNFDFKSSENDVQTELISKSKSTPEFKFLINKVNEFIREKRKPFLRVFASKIVEKFDKEGILPSYKNEWEEKYKKPQLEETLIGLYEAQPKLFINLNKEQKITFVRFLDLLLDSNEKENIFKILDEIIELDIEERKDLAKLFKTTSLNRIIDTIKLIEDRYKVYYMLRDMVFNPNLKANEVDHLQKLIESHYWIFGEQYHLVTAAEPKFEEALRRYIFHLTEKDTSPEIDHPHKLKEMDIFACRQNKLVNRIENIVVELKHPLIQLGEAQYSQIHKYIQVISSQPEFNASNMYWEFYLIGNKFNTSNYIDDLIATNKNHGIPSLILTKNDGRIKVYAKKWSEVFADFEIKHNFIDEKLKLERELLFNELSNPNEIVSAVQNNSAIQPKEIRVKND